MGAHGMPQMMYGAPQMAPPFPMYSVPAPYYHHPQMPPQQQGFPYDYYQQNPQYNYNQYYQQ